jgi:surface antigen
MSHSSLLRCSLVVAALAAAMPALAGSNLRFMKDSPLQQFTPQDMQMFKQTLYDVLDKGADGEAKTWSNPATEATGEIKAVKTFDRSGTPCRSLAISNSAKGLSASGRYNFCKPAAKGKWGLAN